MSPGTRNEIQHFIKRNYRQLPGKITPVSGGCINKCYRIDTSEGLSFFCKTNSASSLPGLFEKEKNGIETIARSGAIAVPRDLFTGHSEDEQWLLMEWIEKGAAAIVFWKNFGAALARMHHQESGTFGFHENNYMGALLQLNNYHESWDTFFISERLVPQVTIACNKGLLAGKYVKAFEQLYVRLPSIFTPEKPCLLHGDLWSGNFICNRQGDAVLIDPAVYYGNRLVDLSMTTLFGGFDETFYEAYAWHYPLPSNFREQESLLNLYPLLIHLNLFGKSYLPSILGTIAAYD